MTIDRRQFLDSGLALAGALAVAPALAARNAAALTSIDAIARKKGLRLGTAVGADHLANAKLAEVIRKECSVLVAENEFKWKHLEPKKGVYRFEGADNIAKFARDNKMLLRGHTFCWNQDNRIPKWQLDMESQLGKGSSSKMVDFVAAHIKAVCKRYPDVASWDAVNEVIQLSDGTVRDSLLTRSLGEKFIDITYALARQAAPKAQMVYNDYMSWDAKPHHRDGVLRMLERAIGRGVKIDALGIQSHIGGSLNKPRDEKAWRKFLENIEAMGLDMLITELDCSDRNVVEKDIPARDAKTAAHVKGYLDLTLSFTRVRQIVLWGISDFDSYLNRPGYAEERRRDDGLPMRGHIYDEAMKPKPMREAIIAAIEAAPVR